MLPDRYRELLTAYVDGELSSRQRRHVARLLRRSPEARKLLLRLQADAKTLRHLPPPPPPPDLTVPVLRSIAERRLTPGQRRVVPVSAGVSWLGPIAAWAAAASVLIILGASSYLYFMTSLDQPPKPDVVLNEPDPPASQPPDTPPTPVRPKEQTSQRPSPSGTAAKKSGPERIKPPELVKHEEDKPKPPISDNPPAAPKEETALTDRFEVFRLERVSDVLPVVVPISSLERESARKDWIAELQKDSAYRLELPCSNTVKAVDRVRNALRASHLGLIVEKQAQERIKQKWRTNYVLYLENVTPEELTRLMQRIGAEDRKSAAGKAVEIQFDRLVLTRWTPRDRKELTTLLGTDASAAPPVVKTTDRFALLMAYLPARPATGSEEIKRFLDSRKPARTGTLRVFLVLRG